MVKAGLGVLAALAAIFAWMRVRRRRAGDGDFQESILAGDVPADTDMTETAEATSATDNTEVASESAKGGASSTDSSLFTDFSVSDMGYMQDDAEADPLAESDVYLAYGRYQQAEELVKAAIAKAPERTDLKFKLLEVLHAARNTPEYDSQAEALLAQLGDQEDPVWQRAAEMGRELNPDNPLYREDGAAETPVAAQASTAETETASDDAKDNLLDFDMEGDTNSTKETAESAASESSEVGMAEPEPATADVLEFNDADLEYDLTVDAADADEEDGGEGELSTSDEAATKLDLARAYIEMGDPEGARSILQEVLEEGNDSQKSEAEGLMSQIA
jgi:pilus assembly protein FimV